MADKEVSGLTAAGALTGADLLHVVQSSNSRKVTVTALFGGIPVAVKPATSDGAALGSTALMWSDLFLASGGVINFNAGNVTITHAANALAFAGASNGYTFSFTVAPSANDGGALGTAALSWADLFLASGAVVNYANGNVVITHSSGVLDVTTGALKVGGAFAKKAGTETIWVPAGAMVANTTNGPASGTVEVASNLTMLKTLDFDATTAESAQFNVRMPKSYNLGTVTAQPIWKHAATTTNFGVVWDVAAGAYSDGDDPAAFGTAVTSTDTGGTTNRIYAAPVTAAITIANTPAAGDWVVFRVRRAPSDGSDTMAIDAGLLGLVLFFTSNAADDT